MENFDAIGRWRETYAKDQRVDSSGALPTGETFTGVGDFRGLLIERHEQFTRALSRNLLTYALGREPGFTDRAVIDDIVKNLSAKKGGFKDLVRAVVLSESFGKN